MKKRRKKSSLQRLATLKARLKANSSGTVKRHISPVSCSYFTNQDPPLYPDPSKQAPPCQPTSFVCPPN